MCLPVFTGEGLAEAFMDELPGKEWEIYSVSRSALLELLKALCRLGLTHVAVDPPPGHDDSGGQVFSIFVKSLGDDGA